MNLFTNIIVYPSADNKLDCRPPTLDAYMLVCFDYIQEPEIDEAIIKALSKSIAIGFSILNEIYNICHDIDPDVDPDIDPEDMKIKPVSEQLRTRNTHTTFFKEKISLS